MLSRQMSPWFYVFLPPPPHWAMSSSEVKSEFVHLCTHGADSSLYRTVSENPCIQDIYVSECPSSGRHCFGPFE